MENRSYLEHALKWGLIMGFSNVLIYLLIYLIDRTSIVSFSIAAVILVVNVVLLVLAVKARKKDVAGNISFGEAFAVALITAVSASLVGGIYNYVMYNWVDPGLSDFLKEQVLIKTQGMMEKFGAPQEEIEKAIDKMQQEDMRMTPGKILVQLMWAALLYTIPSAIIALVMRKPKPSTPFEQ